MKNIYLELELFLDPPITDAGALKSHIEKKISDWNKMVNLGPKYKDRVQSAKKHLAQGLSNLPGQAEAARKEKLQALQSDIKKAGRVGGINDAKFKKLKSLYRDFFTEETIRGECGEVKGISTAVQKPVFTPPKRPDSLVCAKTISFKEMKELTEDLNRVDGSPNNLYEFLQVPPSANNAELYKKAQEKSAYALKMPKTNVQADAMNRIAGKCINFFKDEQNRKNYDIALKRFLFDSLCEMDLQWNIDKENGIPWEIYQESILNTVPQGYTQGEAEWLVYNYYCETNKCPDPIPEAKKPVLPFAPSPFVSAPTAKPKVDVEKHVAKLVESAVKNSGLIYGWTKNWYSKTKESLPAAPSGPIRQTQFDLPYEADFQKVEGLRKKFLQQKNPSVVYLNHLFGELDSIVVQYQMAPAEMLKGVKSFRAEVGEKLGDLMYAEENLVSASQCYRAVLDSMPQHTKAGSRIRMINSTKDGLYRQVNLALAENNFALCKQRIAKLKQKFTGDSETDDFVRKMEQQVQGASISKEYVQQLINEKMWYTLSCVLVGEDQPIFKKVLTEAKKRLDLMDKNINVIRQNLRRGKFAQVAQQLKQIWNVVDYPKYEAFLEEVKQFRRQVGELNSEFKDLIKKKHLIRGENKLRQFLAENPKYRQGLIGYAQIFAGGVTRFQNGLRFWLFAVLGGILFMIIPVLSDIVHNNDGSKSIIGTVLAVGIGFLFVKFVYSGLIRLSYASTKTQCPAGGFGLISTITLFVLVSAATCLAVVPGTVETFTRHIANSDSVTAEQDIETLVAIFRSLACFGFFYLLHVYVFSFFNRCMENEREQPIFLPLLFIPSFTVLLLLTGKNVTETGLLFFTTVAALWWMMTAAIAFLHFYWCREMSMISRADIIDSFQRNKLLRQYKNSDFGQPLLFTDWYQQTLTLAQRQDSAIQTKNRS